MRGGNWTLFLSGRVSLTMLTKDLGTQGLFVLGYPRPDSLLAPYPAPGFWSSLSVRLLPAVPGHPATK